LLGAFEYGGFDSAIGQRYGCGHASISAADHRNIQPVALFTVAPSPSGGGLGRGD
jgi:hypothetical protein